MLASLYCNLNQYGLPFELGACDTLIDSSPSIYRLLCNMFFEHQYSGNDSSSSAGPLKFDKNTFVSSQTDLLLDFNNALQQILPPPNSFLAFLKVQFLQLIRLLLRVLNFLSVLPYDFLKLIDIQGS